MAKRKFQDRIKRNRFARQLRFAAKRQLASGSISQSEFDTTLKAARNKAAMEDTLSQLSAQEGLYGGIDWANVFKWIMENWQAIFKIVTSVMVLLADEK